MTTTPASIDRMASLYGDDLVLWATYFFAKDPGGAEIPWHQDLRRRSPALQPRRPAAGVT